MSTPATVDLNADVGEGFGAWKAGDDEAILEAVSSANIACGFHAGDPPTMRRVCESAVRRGVAIGAHVGYRDLAGFGRRRMDVDLDDLQDEILYQIGALDALARAAGGTVRYVKPHGALYNTATTDSEYALAVVTAVRRFSPGLPILALPDSQLLRQAEITHLPAIPEGYADRAYTAEGQLTSRKLPGSVIEDAGVITQRCIDMVNGTGTATDGSYLPVRPRSICVHGDTPGAVEIVHSVRQGLELAGVQVASFVDITEPRTV